MDPSTHGFKNEVSEEMDGSVIVSAGNLSMIGRMSAMNKLKYIVVHSHHCVHS